jgi:hypothetical protein
MNQSHWALGSWNRREVGDGVFAGTSLFDGSELFVRLVPHPDLRIVDFETGPSADSLRHTVEARVVAGEAVGSGPDTCVVTLTIWRSATTDDAGWDLLAHSFATEIQMIKGRLEHRF